VRRRTAWLGAGLLVTTFALLLLRMLVPVPVGMADNGDGWRLLCHIGANEPDRVSERYVQLTYFEAEAPPCPSAYVSSQEPVLRVAAAVGAALGSGAVLDLRVLSVLSSAVAAVGVTVVALGLPLRPRHRVLAAGLVLLVVADSAFAGYFASVLSEGAAFLGVLLAVGGLLLLQRRGGAQIAAGALLVTGGGVLAANAKGQTLMVVPLLVPVLWLARPRHARRVLRWGVPAVLLLVTGLATLAIQAAGESANREYREVNAYHAIFHSILDGDHDARRDLEALGLPPSFAKYQGTNWFHPGAAHEDPLYAEHRHLVSSGNVARYYLTHPGRTLQILHAAASDHLEARPDNLGSYPESAGHEPLAQEHRVPVLSGLTALLAPLGAFVLWPLWALLGWRTWVALRGPHRDLGVVLLFTLLLAVGQYGLAGLAEGIEGVKHQVIGLFATLLCSALAAVALLPRDEPVPEPDREPVLAGRF
jgi:hypothetical protein